jgi:hypothetical protein
MLRYICWYRAYLSSQLSPNLAADAVSLCDKAAVLWQALKETLCTKITDLQKTIVLVPVLCHPAQARLIYRQTAP